MSAENKITFAQETAYFALATTHMRLKINALNGDHQFIKMDRIARSVHDFLITIMCYPKKLASVEQITLATKIVCEVTKQEMSDKF